MSTPVTNEAGEQVGIAEVRADLAELVADIRLARGAPRLALAGPKAPQPNARKRRRQVAKAARKRNR